ncbi:helix-turn-helix transcriptional regulator [Pseudokineococcus basanitobsidens]|uniref:Helix-turn-helix transcriptional regulator n=1 Tax=Pseudokineococcus basanitobsidens TaxID=1926649 RepID=A0ABU8RHJ1_9ACTN
MPALLPPPVDRTAQRGAVVPGVARIPSQHSRTQQQTAADRGTALVALSSPSLRRAAVRVLRGLGAREVLAAPDAAAARSLATRRAGTVAVVQPSFGGGTGLGLVRDSSVGGWATTVVVDHHREGADAAAAAGAALAAGARCYLVVDPADEEGGSPRSARPADAVAPTGAWQDLSEREVQVISLVAEGRSNRDVGEALGLSALTVKSHLARIARKLRTGDRAEMVAIALRAGLVT